VNAQQSEQDNNRHHRGTDADIAEVDSQSSRMITIMQNNGWFLCGTPIWHPRFSADAPYVHTREFRRRYVAENGQSYIDSIAIDISRNSNYYLLTEAQRHRRAFQEAFNRAYAQDRRLGIKWDLPFNSISPTPEEQTDAVCGTAISAAWDEIKK